LITIAVPIEQIFSAKGPLKAALQIDSEENFRAFLQGKTFFPFWKELYFDYVLPEQQAAQREKRSRTRGPALKDVQIVLMHGEKGGAMKYSAMAPNKENWTASDHLARFLYLVRFMNTKNRDGIFYGKNIAESKMDALVWSLQMLLVKEHQPSRINRAGGGVALVGKLTDESSIPDTFTGSPAKRQHKGTASGEVKKAKSSTPHTPARRGKTAAKETPRSDDESHPDLANDDGDNEDIEQTVESTPKAWTQEVLTPKRRLKLTRSSDVQDLNDPYWKDRLVRRALFKAKRAEVEKDSDEHVESGSDTSNGDAEDLKELNIFDEAQYLDADSINWQHEMDSEEPSALIIPTEASIKSFQKQQSWFDNVLYQRENHAEACKHLDIPNPDIPRMKGMRPSVVLKFWQAVAIYALLLFEAKHHLRGAIIGDVVGLGKTWVVIGYLLAVCKTRDNLPPCG
jgi:hypothetical protein